MQALAEAGLVVEPIALPTMPAWEGAQWVIIMADSAALHSRWMRDRPADYGADVLRELRAGALLSGEEYVRAQQLRRLVVADVAAALREVDAIALPIMPVVAPRRDEIGPPTIDVDGRPMSVLSAFTVHSIVANLAGVPALALPAGWTAAGMPVGVQLLSAAWREDVLLRIGHVLELARPAAPRAPFS